ncbi:hypothetical protein Taro_009151, partial [Colocasia esculenta]|nr:hypothetical protein [Colocasia esculenta]
MSRGVRRGVSSRPQQLRVLRYSIHHPLWTMEYSCKAWSKQCRLRLRLRRHCRLSCRHKLRLQLQFLKSMAMVVQSWMREVEKIFWAIRCAEEDKVSLATYMLQEGADVWWASVICTRYEDGTTKVTWAEFTRLFGAMFIPEHIQDKMEQEFLTLTQGSMTVLEYEAKFAELSKYPPHIVADEHRKAKKFVMGLKPSLRLRLVAFDRYTLNEALRTSCRQESEMDQYLEEKRAAQNRCFYLLKMKDYDAILSLDWLEEHYGLVDCRGKKITFHIPREDEFLHQLPRNLVGRLVISAMKAMRMVNKGCDTFLASVVLVPKADQSPILEEIEVVQEFPDVFLDDLSGLPPA